MPARRPVARMPRATGCEFSIPFVYYILKIRTMNQLLLKKSTNNYNAATKKDTEPCNGLLPDYHFNMVDS